MIEKQPINAMLQGQSVQAIDRKLAVAPMMDWTGRHCRYFLRGFSPRVLLYTEMITAEALLRGNAPRLLRYLAEEQPLALQMRGEHHAGPAAAALRVDRAGVVGHDLT